MQILFLALLERERDSGIKIYNQLHYIYFVVISLSVVLNKNFKKKSQILNNCNFTLHTLYRCISHIKLISQSYCNEYIKILIILNQSQQERYHCLEKLTLGIYAVEM